jgi:hypothetical protein
MARCIAGPRDAPCTPGGIGRCDGPNGFRLLNGKPVVYVGEVDRRIREWKRFGVGDDRQDGEPVSGRTFAGPSGRAK